MKVSELIKQLETLDPEMEVFRDRFISKITRVQGIRKIKYSFEIKRDLVGMTLDNDNMPHLQWYEHESYNEKPMNTKYNKAIIIE